MEEIVSFKGLVIGQRAEIKRVFTQQDVAEYLSLAEDVSAADFNAESRAIPAPLLGGMFSFLLGTKLPGYGTNYLKQRLIFRAPAFPGEEIKATVEVVRLRPEKELVNLRTTCADASGETICEGEALVLVRDLESDE